METIKKVLRMEVQGLGETQESEKVNPSFAKPSVSDLLYPLVRCRRQMMLLVRVAKCQIFYTEQIFQTKFYPKKSA